MVCELACRTGTVTDGTSVVSVTSRWTGADGHLRFTVQQVVVDEDDGTANAMKTSVRAEALTVLAASASRRPVDAHRRGKGDHRGRSRDLARHTLTVGGPASTVGMDAGATEIREERPMAAIMETAERFFEACETGQGWGGCERYCHPDATFSAQAAALERVDSLQAYTEWMKGLLIPLPDGQAEVRSFAVDVARNKVSAYGVFHGTHTGEGGPVAPTGKSVAADYVYDMAFEGDKIRHMTKIWNDGETMQQLGWA